MNYNGIISVVWSDFFDFFVPQIFTVVIVKTFVDCFNYGYVNRYNSVNYKGVSDYGVVQKDVTDFVVIFSVIFVIRLLMLTQVTNLFPSNSFFDFIFGVVIVYTVCDGFIGEVYYELVLTDDV